MELLEPLVDPDDAFISTGKLPAVDRVVRLVEDAHARFGAVNLGQNSQVYPALARVPEDLFGICVAGVDGRIFSVGDAEHEFTIMSVSKPFIFALICDVIGATGARERLGVNATGHAFNSLAGIERDAQGHTNPMVNAGAIATTSLAPGGNEETKWRFLHEGLSRFAGRNLALNDEVYASASETNFRNRSIAWMLQSLGRIYSDPMEAVELYHASARLTSVRRIWPSWGRLWLMAVSIPLRANRLSSLIPATMRWRSC